MGAKTASGYGCFKPDTRYKIPEPKHSEKQYKQLKAELEKMSPIRREMEEDGYSSPDIQKFISVINDKKWLKRMDDLDTKPVDRLEIAQLLAEWYMKNKPKD